MAEGRYKRDKPFHDPGWESLANAIVIQAANDYRLIIGVGRRKCDAQSYAFNAAEIERFFGSSWFTFLTGLDGKSVFKKFKKMVEEEYDNQKISLASYKSRTEDQVDDC